LARGFYKVKNPCLIQDVFESGCYEHMLEKEVVQISGVTSIDDMTYVELESSLQLLKVIRPLVRPYFLILYL